MKIAAQCVCCNSDVLQATPAILMPFVADRVFGWKPVQVMPEWGLRTIPCSKMYTPCNSLRCHNCGLEFLDMRFDDDEAQRLYAGYRGEQYTALRDSYEPGYSTLNRLLSARCEYTDQVEAFLQPDMQFPVSVLDWGGDTGHNAPFAGKRRLLHVHDISANDTAADAVKIDAVSTCVYDLVVCNNVLEHVAYPADMLCQLIRKMDERSILYIGVPDEQHGTQRHWWHEHINRFTEKALRHLVKQCQLTVRKVNTFTVDTSAGRVHQIQMECSKL